MRVSGQRPTDPGADGQTARPPVAARHRVVRRPPLNLWRTRLRVTGQLWHTMILRTLGEELADGLAGAAGMPELPRF